MSTIAMSSSAAPSFTKRQNYPAAIAVLLVHVAAFWALQNGLLHRAVEVIVPAQILVQFIDPATPKAPPPPPMPATPLIKPLTQMLLPPPEVAITAEPTANTPTAVVAPQQALPSTIKSAQVTAPPKIELPSSDADYLQNPKPVYPPLSKRLNEQGKVVIRVLIGLDGNAQQAEIAVSSGYERLDQAALVTAQKWRYVPGKRNGVPEAMWFNVPINFVLEKR